MRRIAQSPVLQSARRLSRSALAERCDVQFRVPSGQAGMGRGIRQRPSKREQNAAASARARMPTPRLLAQIVYIDLVGKEGEEAREALLDGLYRERERLSLPSSQLTN